MTANKYIDHTLLKPGSTKEEIRKVCEEAKQYDFASVCVNPVWVSFVAEQLKGTDVKTCSVICFPLGALTPEMKAARIEELFHCAIFKMKEKGKYRHCLILVYLPYPV